jgi:hypothetical protein
MRRHPAIAEGALVVALGLGALGLGAATSALAEPAAVVRPAASAIGAIADAGEPMQPSHTAGHGSGEFRGSAAIPAGRIGDESLLALGRLAAWTTSDEPQDARIELLHTASAARGRPMALLYIELDWRDLIGTGSGSHAHSARPRQLAESTGA